MRDGDHGWRFLALLASDNAPEFIVQKTTLLAGRRPGAFR
jgi:hypothetical protein